LIPLSYSVGNSLEDYTAALNYAGEIWKLILENRLAISVFKVRGLHLLETISPYHRTGIPIDCGRNQAN
jgi:hypothetical protein